MNPKYLKNGSLVYLTKIEWGSGNSALATIKFHLSNGAFSQVFGSNEERLQPKESFKFSIENQPSKIVFAKGESGIKFIQFYDKNNESLVKIGIDISSQPTKISKTLILKDDQIFVGAKIETTEGKWLKMEPIILKKI